MKTLSRIFVIVLFVVMLHCSLSSTAQQVTIKKETAEYFLEADDERWKLRKIDSTQQVEIGKLKAEVFKLRTAVTSFQVEEILNAEIYDEQFEEIIKRDEYIEFIERRLRKQQRWTAVAGGAAGGALTGCLVGQPLAGTILGGAVGYFANLFKRKHDQSE